MLSYLHHFLRIMDGVNILTTHNNCNNLNLLDISSRNNPILGIGTEVFANTTDI